MSIKIIKAGSMSTLQADARTGLRDMAVGTGGAMDDYACAIANYLCGNEKNAATLELHLPGAEILFNKDAIISITGQGFFAEVNQKVLPAWRTIFIKKNSILKFPAIERPARAWVAVNGGFAADQWMHSYSTHLKLGVAGHYGRALKKDDRIEFFSAVAAGEQDTVAQWAISPLELEKVYAPRDIIRCITGPEYTMLNLPSQNIFNIQEFRISELSDRMGFRLAHERLSLEAPLELVSSPVDLGTIQLLPDGSLVILMADHQTTGGFPRVASVIRADLPKLSALTAGQSFKFVFVSIAEAESIYLERQKNLQELKQSCHLHLQNYLAQ